MVQWGRGTGTTLLVLLVVVLSPLWSVTAAPDVAPPARRPMTTPVILGVNPGNPNDLSKIGQVDQYTAAAGVTPRIVQYFLSWSDGGSFNPTLADAITARGATPMISWLSSDWREGKDQPLYSDRRIANGAYDPLLTDWGRALGQWGKPVFLRLDDEMNGNWYPWSPGVNGNTLQDYLDMWRHVVTTMRTAGGGLPNVYFVWSPNVTSQEAARDFRPMYPGDAYVNWVALDGYNWGQSRSSGWQSWTEIFGRDYDTLQALAPSKPVMIAETGSEDRGGDKAAWLMQTFTVELPQRFPAVRAVIYFNEDKRSEGEGNWLLSTSPSVMQAWRNIASSPLYSGAMQ